MTDSTQIADKYLVERAESIDYENRYSKGKSMAYVIDLNQGSYNSGQVILDTTNQTSGASGYASLRDSYVVIPFVTTMKNIGTNATGAAANGFSMGFKCNVANIIDRIQVELDNKTSVTPQYYLNMANNIRTMTEWSLDDVQKFGTGSYLIPDEIYSIGYSPNATDPSGDGFFNNYNYSSAPLATAETGVVYPFNKGLFQRQFLSAATDVASGNTFGWPTLTSTNVANTFQQQGKSSFVPGATTSTMGTWYTMLKIRLVDLHPIFKELDLSQNPRLKLTMYINTGTAVATIGANAAAQVSLSSVSLTQGSTCPVMLTSAATNNSNASVLQSTSGTQVGISWGVLGNSYTATSATSNYFPFTTTRLYIPFYDLLPEVERPLIESPLKTSHFLDFYTQSWKGYAGAHNGSFQLQLSANLKNIKWIALLPFNNNSSVGYYKTASNVDQYASPFDSAPWTVQPGSALVNVNFQVGNKWVFNNQISYDWQTFYDEFSKISALNGALENAIGNGLIDENKWAFGQRIIMADVSRLTSPDVPASVLIQGTNICDQSTDFIAIVAYERSITQNRITGEVANVA